MLTSSLNTAFAKHLCDLQDERASGLEATSANRQALHSQISCIRETINRILHEDTMLTKGIHTLFHDQGITIGSILTAIGLAISTLMLALTGSGGATPSLTPPQLSDKGGLREWVKKHLQTLGHVLAKLAAALPCIVALLSPGS